MDRFVNHDELIEALGAYALDAMEPEEAQVVRRHLEECPRCAEEVAQHQRVAALLGNTGGEAPEHLWDAIAGQIGETRSSKESPRAPSERPGRAGRPLRTPGAGRSIAKRPWVLAAAAAIVVIALLSVQVARLDGRAGSLNSLAASALASPAARTVNLQSAKTGLTDAQVVVLPSGAAYLLNRALPPLPASETYQLWGRTGDQLISLGVLGSQPTTVAFTVGLPAQYRAYVVTAEHAGGVVRTGHRPVAMSRVESA